MKEVKKVQKADRELEVLFGLIEAFLENGKPIGSGTLKEASFDHLSSATIRNYFAKLEEDGYLTQTHSSGGRIPTEKAFRLYAQKFTDLGVIESETLEAINEIKKIESKEVVSLIQKSVEDLSRLTDTCAFISLPRFDRDFLVDIKVLPIDSHRILFALVTDFGSIQTEVLRVEERISLLSAKRIEAYLKYRLTGNDKPANLEVEEEQIGLKFYNEVVIRFLVGYSNVINEEVLRAGFSKLLHYPESHDPAILAESLALFENSTSIRHLLRDAAAHDGLRFWIGSDLIPFHKTSKDTAVIAIPYYVNTQAVGALAVLSPMRVPYRKIFGALRAMSAALSVAITHNLYKFKITYRQPEHFQLMIPDMKLPRIGYKNQPLIEGRKR